jgi:hypothetical protein
MIPASKDSIPAAGKAGGACAPPVVRYVFPLRGGSFVPRGPELITCLMARAKKTPPKESLTIHSLTLTPATAATLRQLSTDAADYIGRAVSGSAIVRALLRHIEQYPASWVQARIFPFVEKELESGMVWGSKKK